MFEQPKKKPLLNILQCDSACTGCVKQYKKKHGLGQGGEFRIVCSGIPKEYISEQMIAQLSDEDAQTMLSMVDPVTWAASVLDWHCLDPDGSIWQRKTKENSLGEVTPYKEEYEDLVKQGKSAFNRSYQAAMLRCRSKWKVFRLGRQLGKTETLCVAILHAVFTHQNFKVIVITPYQAQIDMIFKRLVNLIHSSPITANSLKRNVRAPNYTLELHNGATIMGFTAGTKSGGNADAVRGQRANMLVFDEADYLSPGDMASSLAVITNFPDATVWMSSTPTGKHEKFYDACHDLTYKEFHYPSMINPLWNKDLEDFYHSQLTDIQYQHEILATFGEQEQGVYQGRYIDEAMFEYEYSDQTRDAAMKYIIGVDWNDVKIGTTIYVVGFDPRSYRFKVVTHDTVQREGWTQHAACQRIIDMNRYWRPEFIYIDKGFGGTQGEILRKFGYDNLATLRLLENPEQIERAKVDGRLANIVKEYDFGSKVTTKDLFTRQDREKPAKPFLVENSVRRFEQHQLMFSKSDTQLEAELRGYIIDHINISGAPVYAQGNEKVGDHNLDALNLALVGFTLEMSPWGQSMNSPNVGFGGQFGEASETERQQQKKEVPSVWKPFNVISHSKEESPESNKPNTDRVTPIIQKKLVPNATPAYHIAQPLSFRIYDPAALETDIPTQVNRNYNSPLRSIRPTRKNI